MKTHLIICSASALLIALTMTTQAAVTLGTAANFGVLAGSTITNTGNTAVAGDIGVHSGTSITGFFDTSENDGPGTFTGTAYQGGAIAQQAQVDANSAFTTLNGLAVNTSAINVQLGGQVLSPGVYELGTAELTGILTLDGAGDYVFKIASTLTTEEFASVGLTNGAEASNVYWAVGSSATLGGGTQFAGNVIAHTSVGLVTGASVNGRLIALNGAVTMDSNTIIPEPSTISFLAILSFGLIVRRRRAAH